MEERPWYVDFESVSFLNIVTSKYAGGITYLSAFGQSIVVLNDLETNKDFFDKRSKNYSHRPQTVVVGELMGLNKVCVSVQRNWLTYLHCSYVQTIVFQDYTERYRAIRKSTQQVLNPDASRKYQPLQIDIIKLFLDRVRVDPEDFREQCRLWVFRDLF